MDIDTDILISAVECRPILWDKSQEMYRDRNGTKNAWEEVCVELKSNFNSLQNSEKNEFGKEVIRRWTNVRDAFAKSCKKEKENKKSGSGAFKHKKYVYNDQLLFLKKLYIERDVVENFENDNNDTLNSNIDIDTDINK
ncbi:uncharacterized protein LOC113557621 [Rhopalosiphum maidis]|uniref:uncharacterized protein LOC113557621 n=1 Tax=Rhopalosiphum maidis TaxID=43146 RepID=UPI000EFE150E|nr:uncharacterized protein LOC113557621 [Rhopalosiphum maidis]